MLDALGSRCPTVEILPGEGQINAERGARALASGDDGELHVFYDIACYKNPGDAGRLILTTADAAAAIELTPQGRRQL